MERPGPTKPEVPAALADIKSGEARFRRIIENNADGMLVVSGDGVILYANEAAERLLNRRRSELLGHAFGIPTLAGETTEIDLPWCEGAPRTAEMRVVETEWEGRHVRLASLRDISDRKRLEDELRQKIAELALADQRKDQFLAMLAHELRNPLAPILNAVHVMRLRGDDPELRESMRDIVEEQVRCLARLVDDLLDVSRITQGKIQLRREPILLRTLVKRSIDAARSLLQAKGHRLEVTLPDEPVKLWVDPIRLEKVVVNLLNNAAKYTDPGGRVELEAELEGDHVEIRIRDNGIGIAPEMVEQVFGLFTQVDHSLARTQGGLGIGLTLARNLVHLHEGTLTTQSKGLGRGSQFTLRIPSARVIDEGAGAPTRTPSVGHGRPKRILLVDDNTAAAESLRLIVKLWGHECRVVHGGLEAVEAVGIFRPEVVLLDIGLPGMDGYTVAKAVRANPHVQALTIIAMTGYGRDEDRARAYAAGFDHHLVKPLDLGVLERILAQLDHQATPGSGTGEARAVNDHQAARADALDRESCG